MNQNNWTFGVFNEANTPAVNFNSGVTATTSEEPLDYASLYAVTERMYKFSTKLYQSLVNSEKNNVICSPLGVGIVLSMAAFGARGITEQQLRSGLCMHENDEINKNGFQSLINALNRVKSVELKLAQKIFIKDHLEMKVEFKNITKNNFKSEAQSLNFNNSQTASEIINNWCSNKTNGRFNYIVSPDTIQGALIILVSAVYFNGVWTSKFKLQDTQPRSFYINDYTTIKVDMMYQKNSFNYGILDALDAAYVELPYQTLDFKDSISMFIILPNKNSGLQRVEEKLDTINIKSMHDFPQKTEMFLYLPKFKFENTFDLTPVLQRMGMTDMFINYANFSGITETIPLKIDQVIQKAFIKVDENGTEAAAISATTMCFGSALSQQPIPITFNVDHPFVYAIYHSSSNTILFQGHVTSLPPSTV